MDSTKGTEMIQTAADRAILDVRGSDSGPQFIGPRAVDCHNYDEHRQGFGRVNGSWVCGVCDDENWMDFDPYLGDPTCSHAVLSDCPHYS
jgi:hypothetical protein